MESKRVGIYCRVSTKDQNPENQLLDLRKYCNARGWKIAGEFTDLGYSGSKENRPQLDAVMNLARKRKIDLLLVWRFDRFARSLPHLIRVLEELKSRGVEFVSYQENIDTSTPQGRMFFGIVGSIAEFERSIIVERILAGLRRAKEKGKRLGRPEVDKSLSEALRMRQDGLSYREIGNTLAIGKSTVSRLLSQKPHQKLVVS